MKYTKLNILCIIAIVISIIIGFLNPNEQYITGDYISPKSLLCSDSAKNYISFAKLKGLEHKQVNAHKKIYVIEKIYHV